MSVSSTRGRVRKVHLLGPWTMGGFRRTLCGQGIIFAETPEEATCEICKEKAK